METRKKREAPGQLTHVLVVPPKCSDRDTGLSQRPAPSASLCEPRLRPTITQKAKRKKTAMHLVLPTDTYSAGDYAEIDD